MVLPSENLHAALAGGLGRLDLSCDMLICAEARVATANNNTVIKANFFMVPPGIRLNDWLLAKSNGPHENYTHIPVTICRWPSSTKSRQNSNTTKSAWACPGDVSP